MHKKSKLLTPNEETIEAMKAARRGDVIKVKDRAGLWAELNKKGTTMHKKRKPGIFVTHKRYVRRPGDNRKTMRVKMRGHAIVCFNIPDKIAAKIIKDIEAGKSGVWRNFVTVVSDRDFKTIMAALDNPPEPNEKLKELMRLHQEIYHGDKK